MIGRAEAEEIIEKTEKNRDEDVEKNSSCNTDRQNKER